MKHNYDTDQLKAAHKVAAKKISINELHTTKYLSAFLDALPEPATDGWQECAWGDILPTDERVKAEYDSGTIIEGAPDEISDDRIYLSDGIPIWYSENAKWYRIPAPVVHPDPAEHPVILIPRYNGVDKEPHWAPAVWNGQYYKITSGDECVSSVKITNWKPGKVVEDDR